MATPPLRFLKTFRIAARRGSFKAAADELCITASAVSHQIKILENQLGLVLFERGPRLLTLTAAGVYYLEHIEAVFARLESATEQLRVRFRRQVVRLQVPPFFASELLLPRLKSFSALHGDTDIQIATGITPNEVHAAIRTYRYSSVAANGGMCRPRRCSRRPIFLPAHPICCETERSQRRLIWRANR